MATFSPKPNTLPSFHRVPLPVQEVENRYASRINDNATEQQSRLPNLRASIATPKPLPKTPGLGIADRKLELLKESHRDVLKSLYDEIEALKLENRDLKFRFVMRSAPDTSDAPVHSEQEEILKLQLKTALSRVQELEFREHCTNYLHKIKNSS